jgi:CHAD domain-containing protein
MADGKWIEGLTADAPLTAAAVRALGVRLELVNHALPRAVHDADRDPEHVHQLRVGSRRADAALRIFSPCLPKKAYKDARKQLRRLRRAAGAARDWDVFLLDLGEWRAARPDREQPGLDFLIGYAHGLRAAAQVGLEAAAKEERPRLDALVKETTGAVRPPHDELPRDAVLVDLARPLLAGRLHELEWAASGDLTDYARLHQVRIAAKRLRYAMEVFADCFPTPFREELYPRVEEVQDVLGRANDSHVAEGRLEALRARLRAAAPAEWKRVRAGVEALLRFHRRRLPQERKRFLQWWEEWGKTGAPTLRRLLGRDAESSAPAHPRSDQMTVG